MRGWGRRSRIWCTNALGTFRVWSDIGYAVGALIAGVLADTFGLNATVAAAAILTAGPGLLAVRWNTEHAGGSPARRPAGPSRREAPTPTPTR
jgi:hypothetical protein